MYNVEKVQGQRKKIEINLLYLSPTRLIRCSNPNDGAVKNQKANINCPICWWKIAAGVRVDCREMKLQMYEDMYRLARGRGRMLVGI
jgi:hypothetical protein